MPALVLALGVGINVPAIPALAKSFGVSFGVASAVITVYLLGNFVSTLPSGWMIDRFGRRRVLISAPLIIAATAFLVAGAQSFPELLVLRFINGFAAQMWLMARLTAISQNASADQRGRLVTWMFGMDNTGRLSGPLLGGFIATDWGSRAPFVVYAVLALTALVPTIIFAKDTPRHRREPEAHGRAAAPQLSLREIIVPRLPYFLVAIFAGLTRGPLQADLMHLYAAFVYHLGPRQIGFLATAASLVSWPIGFLAGWLMDRFGRKRTMVPGFTGVAIAMSALAASAFLHFSFAWYVALFLFGVALQALTGGSVQTIGTDVAPPQARGKFLGMAFRKPGRRNAKSDPLRLDRRRTELRLVVPVHRDLGDGGARSPYPLRPGNADTQQQRLAQIQRCRQIGRSGIACGQGFQTESRLDQLEDRRRIVGRVIDEALFGER